MAVFALKNTKQRVLALVGAAALSVTMVMPTLAADDANVTVTGGDLVITTAPTVTDFSGVTLNGTAQTTTATLDTFEVNDARGTGAGWHVTAQATQFKEHDGSGYVSSGKTLATGSLVMEDVTPAADGTSSGLPTAVGPYTIDSASPVSVASAAAGNGMGKYDFTGTAGGGNITLTLSVPASAYARTYRSDVTVDVVTAPYTPW